MFTYGDNLSDVSDPQLELSDKSVLNFLVARGEDGAFLAHICVWMCSHTLRKRLILPVSEKKKTFRNVFYEGITIES